MISNLLRGTGAHDNRLDRLRAAIGGLSPEARDVFIAAVVQGRSMHEIVAQVGLDRPQVEARLAEALVALAAEMDGQKRGGGWRWRWQVARSG